MGDFNNSGASSASSSSPTLGSINPSQLETGLMNALAGDITASSDAAKSIGSFFQPNPLQIAPLTSGTLTDIAGLQNAATEGTTGLNNAFGVESSLTSGPVGSSPATVAGMQAQEQLVDPTIANDVALTGGRGGALESAIGQSNTAAAVPLIQQEIANRNAAVGNYTNLGAQQTSNLESAIGPSQLPQQTQQEVYNAQQADYLRRMGLSTSEINAILPVFQALSGTSNYGSITSAPSPLSTAGTVAGDVPGAVSVLGALGPLLALL